MMKCARHGVLAAMMLLAIGAPSAQESVPANPANPPVRTGPIARDSQRQSFAWWKSDRFQKELGLTADQSARIDKIWQTARLELRQEWDELSRLEAKLSRLIQNDADEAILSRQVDRVETARANANKTRSMMLLQMRKVLTTEQRTRLDALHSRLKELRDQPSQPSPVPPPDSRKPRD